MLKKIKSHPLFKRATDWAKLLGVTGTAQVGVQAIGLLSGVLVIRLLSTDEYALYTLANTMLSTMVMLANAGIPIAVMSEGGKVWKNKEKLGEVLVTGFDFRKKFAIGSLILGIPILSYLLYINDASILMTILIVLGLIPVFYTQLSDVLLQIAPKLKQDIVPLQKNLVLVNLGRLFLLGLSLILFPFAVVAIFSASIPQILGNFNLKKIAKPYADWHQKPSTALKKKMSVTVKRVLPEALYYSISGQITIWILSIFGSTTSIAEIGALGRIAMVINLVSIIFGMLVVPRFARLENTFNLLFKRFIQVQILVIGIFGILIGFVYLFPEAILWVLGPQYANLKFELFLAVIGGCLSVFSGIVFSLYSSRGWIINPTISIPLNLATLCLAIWVTDVTSLTGVLFLNIIIGTVQLATHSGYGFFKIFKLKTSF
ncbi:MATE family efflux transporter [Maribacter litoralis]|uniref:Membrane protein involved in the export of O-antigen and teichoic acid n=1 Tax=Maribacter litoralis TaxID=2059726 RepID=A0A653SLX1_9FLAO|nr:polysaccharide biosynthesis protein [Maribacter litoralis]VXB65980.1 Membrane protein involved in the export of O-antigen and teichoic acid [Maribacter litoralis]